MALIKKSIRFISFFFTACILLILIYLLLAWLLPFFKINASFEQSTDGVEIFIQSNGVHTNFILPVKNQQKDWSERLPYSDFKKADSTFKYISFGWGDKDFFIGTPSWNDFNFKLALKATFALGSAAIHATYIHNKPLPDELCKRLVISKKQYHLLVEYIDSSFQQRNNKFILIDVPGYSDNDRFYEANGVYSLFKTCNVWTGEGLKLSGIKVGIWTPSHKGVLKSLD